MAARENQGYLIAVIILVLLSLVLALVAFLGVQGAYEQADTAKSFEQKAYVAQKQAEAESFKAEAYAAMIGSLGTAPAELAQAKQDLKQLTGDSRLSQAEKEPINRIIEDVSKAEEVFQIDTKGAVSVAAEGTDGEATLRSRIADLTALVDRLRKDLLIQRKQAEEADRKAKVEIAQVNQTLESNNKELADLQVKLQEEKEASLVKENTLKKEVEAEKKAFADLNRKTDEAAQKAAFDLRTANDKIAKLEVDNSNLKIRLNKYEKEYFDNADGQVIRVASALNTVFIDIGSADGLTLNRTFTIYDQAVTDFENAEPKGKIEVIRVGGFRSEAKITEQSVTDPILNGDHILTATWDPGFSVQIALAGRFDLDGDRYDDTEKLTRMIERNGGRVVVGHDSEGKINGKMTPGIRYLVKGNESIVGDDDDPNAGAILSAIRTLEASAEQNTIQVITLQKLLNRMGVRNQPKTQKFDFPAGGFSPRRPGAIRGGSPR
jgi:hypothetical protein